MFCFVHWGYRVLINTPYMNNNKCCQFIYSMVWHSYIGGTTSIPGDSGETSVFFPPVNVWCHMCFPLQYIATSLVFV